MFIKSNQLKAARYRNNNNNNNNNDNNNNNNNNNIFLKKNNTLFHSYLYKIFTIKLLKQKKLITIFKSLLETLICPFFY